MSDLHAQLARIIDLRRIAAGARTADRGGAPVTLSEIDQAWAELRARRTGPAYRRFLERNPHVRLCILDNFIEPPGKSPAIAPGAAAAT